MQLSTVNLKPHLSEVSPGWTRDVMLSERAVEEIQQIAADGKVPMELALGVLACHFTAFLNVFANNHWFSQIADHDFVGFKCSNPDQPNDDSCSDERHFVMRRDGYGEKLQISIVSVHEGYLTEQYHIGQAIEIAKMIAANMKG